MVTFPASSQASRLSPEILAALPEWIDPDEAAEWPKWQLERAAYKRCTLCGEFKLRTAFHGMRSMYDGRYPRCKECRGAQRLERLRASPRPARAAGDSSRVSKQPLAPDDRGRQRS